MGSIGCPKRREQTTNLRGVNSQKNINLMHSLAESRNHAMLYSKDTEEHKPRATVKLPCRTVLNMNATCKVVSLSTQLKIRTYQFAVLRNRVFYLMAGQFDLDSHVNKSDTAQ